LSILVWGSCLGLGGTVVGTVAAATLHEKLVATLLSLLGTLSDQGHVSGLLGLVLLSASTLESDTGPLALELLRGDQTLDLWCLGVLLATLGGDGSTDDELAHILLGAEAEELADLGGALWAETHRLGLVGEAGNLLLALLDDDEVQHRQVLGDDASTDRLALHLTSAALAVALASLAEEQTHALWGKNTLHHWETLFVVSSRDAESVSLELIAEGVAIDLLGDTLVEEWQQLLVVINVDGLLRARFGACNVELP